MLSTSTLLQCISNLIPEFLFSVILQTFSTSVGRLTGKLVQESVQYPIWYCGVEESWIQTTPTNFLPEVAKITNTSSPLPIVLSVFISSGIVSRSISGCTVAQLPDDFTRYNRPHWSSNIGVRFMEQDRLQV